jgi:hypothetical protein
MYLTTSHVAGFGAPWVSHVDVRTSAEVVGVLKPDHLRALPRVCKNVGQTDVFS